MVTADLPFTVVIGLGRSGVGAARLLAASGERVRLIESKSNEALERRAADLRREGIEVSLATPLEPHHFRWAAGHAVKVVVSPGVRWDHPTLVQLRRQGVEVIGEMEVAWGALASVPWIGITGTNGKTTVTHLVGHLLQAAGLDAPICGNVGLSAAELALERLNGGQAPPDWLVAELSSYQIEAAPGIRPRIGLWTTLTPDHLERHGSLDNYRGIKRSLLERAETAILNADDADLASRAASWDGAIWVTARSKAHLGAGINPLLWVEHELVHGVDGPLMAANCLAMPGAHNRQNMLMAAAVGLRLGLDPLAMEAAFRSFPGVPHRLERIRELDGVTYYNDSKATNFDAAEVAVKALGLPLVVLAGGEAKQGDPSGWIEQLNRHAQAVVLYGEAAGPFDRLLSCHGYCGERRLCPGLEEAVPSARQLAKRLDCGAVLLSPACASFDQYSDFEARGDHFRRLVSGL
jgi:UDP-N-acetylmuramoylalanine--D-glutamate ligase